MDKESSLEVTDTGTKVCQEGAKSVIINLSKANVINYNPPEQQQPEDIPIEHNSWSPIAKGFANLAWFSGSPTLRIEFGHTMLLAEVVDHIPCR